MVYIQVSDVHSLLDEVNVLKENGWKEVMFFGFDITYNKDKNLLS